MRHFVLGGIHRLLASYNCGCSFNNGNKSVIANKQRFFDFATKHQKSKSICVFFQKFLLVRT